MFALAWVAGRRGAGVPLSARPAGRGRSRAPAGIPAMIGLAGFVLAPLVFFYVLAHMVWRSQELRLIAQSMAGVAMRLSEPEEIAREFDRDRRPGDPPRGRGDGRRRRARAGARRRARGAGRQRSVGARARLQRQRSPHPRPARDAGASARHAGRPGRAGAQRHHRRASRSVARHFLGQRPRRRAGQRERRRRSPRRSPRRASTSRSRSAAPAIP